LKLEFRIVAFFAFVMFACFPAFSSDLARNLIDDKTKNHFLQVFLPTPEDVISKWEKPIRIKVLGGPIFQNTFRKNKNFFEKMISRKIVITDENVNFLIIFTDNIYREAFQSGSVYFRSFLKTKEEIFDFFHRTASAEELSSEKPSNVTFRKYHKDMSMDIVVSLQSLDTKFYNDINQYVISAVLDALVEKSPKSESKFEYPTVFDKDAKDLSVHKIDEDIISLLYRDEIESGMNRKKIKSLFR